jgi:acyl-CoA reductase-like NAD-dependent aldehyde dehydrogenase
MEPTGYPEQAEGQAWEIFSPLDGSSLGVHGKSDPADVRKALERQRLAWPPWRSTPLEQRVGYLRKAREAFFQRVDEIVDIVHRETGKPVQEIYGAEIIANLELFDFHIRRAGRTLADEPVRINRLTYPGKKGYIAHRPLGIVGVLSSWNYPVALPLRAIVPALAAGNCVAFKPSVDATLTGRVLASVFEAVLPDGVFLAAYGGREVSRAIIDAADKINFIGSVETGRKVAVRCAERFIPCSSELSGKDAAIVLGDCHLDRAVDGVLWGAFTNAGQNCASIERALVDASIYDEFLDRLVKRAERLRIGQDVGPLRNERQMRLVEAHVENARQAGCRVLTGGRRVQGGLYFEPTVIAVTCEDAAFLREETFGPTLPVMRISGLEEGIRRANDSRFGLTVSVWTGDTEAARKIAERMETGIVTVNNAVFTGALAGAPWGGVKETGDGVTNSRYGLLEMTRPQFVLVDRSRAPRESWWYPYTGELTELMKGVVETLGGRVAANLRVLRLLRKVQKQRIGSAG